MNADDERFVASSWFESFWKLHAYRAGVPFAHYRPGMDARIRRLMHNVPVTVAYATVAPTEIVGWACIEGECLHYVYVKSAYRRQGVARALVSRTAREYSHPSSRAGQKFVEALGLTFNPYRLERE
jgi:GNAT superfamily N-acetyltransferase